MNAQDQRLLVALGIAVVVHLPVTFLGGMALLRDSDGGDDLTYLEVTPMPREVDPFEPTEEEEEEDERYEPEDSLPEGQVVDAAEAGEERRPEDARFLSTRDQVVDDERQAVLRVRGPIGVSAQPEGPQAVTGAVARPAQRRSPMIAGLMLQESGLRPDERGDHAARQLPPPATPSAVDLRPSVAVLSDAIRGTGLDDLGDIEEGQGTLLSTARWLHAPFFQRVKHAVEQYWHPDRAFARHDPGGHVYGYRDRETVIRVVLDDAGALVRAYVLRPSGADFLDDEARNAIRQAAPFPNPPRALVDEESQRIVFTFGFVVELGERPIFRLRRYGE